MNNVTSEWIMTNIDVVLAIVVLLLLFMFLMFWITLFRIGQMRRRYKSLMKGINNGNLEEILFKYGEDVHQLETQVREVIATHSQLQRDIHISTGPIGVVRYNAFPGTGSDLSYSIAILNRDVDGVVFTSIYGREESRSYAKPITAGTSTYPLSDEEKQAIQIAIEKMK